MFAPAMRMFGGDPPTLRVRLAYKTSQFDVDMDTHATFGELRYEAKTLTGLPMDGFKLLFRGRERADSDPLLMSGLKNGAIVQVVETLDYQNQIRAARAGVQRSQHSAAAANGPAAGAWNPVFPQAPAPQQPAWRPEFPPASAASTVASPAAAASAAASAHSHQQSPAQPRERERSQEPQPSRGAAASSARQDGPPTAQPTPAQAGTAPIGPQPAPQPAETLEQQLMRRVDVQHKELDGLTTQVDGLEAGGPATARSAAGEGAPPAKQILVLAELLTRVLLALDGIRPPDGEPTPPEVRAARKAAVLRAQGLVDRVEAAKAAAK